MSVLEIIAPEDSMLAWSLERPPPDREHSRIAYVLQVLPSAVPRSILAWAQSSWRYDGLVSQSACFSTSRHTLLVYLFWGLPSSFLDFGMLLLHGLLRCGFGGKALTFWSVPECGGFDPKHQVFRQPSAGRAPRGKLHISGPNVHLWGISIIV